MAELLALVVKGPDPDMDRVVRWRRVDLRDEVQRRCAVSVRENTIRVWLREMRLTRLPPRPFHPKKDPTAQTALKNFGRLIAAALPQATLSAPWQPAAPRAPGCC